MNAKVPRHAFMPDPETPNRCKLCGWQKAGHVFEVMPHVYVPDVMAQGDCQLCGHVPESSMHVTHEQLKEHKARQERVDASIVTQLSDSMALNSKYAIAIKATIDDLERRMSAENSSIIDRLRAVLR